jgi:hypothetical protein
LDSLLDVLNFEAHLRLIGRQLFEGATTVKLPTTFKAIVTHW